MIIGMTTVKRAVTLDEELDREAQALSGGNFSAFVSEALVHHVRRAKLDQLVRRDVDERGAIDASEQAAVDAELAAFDGPTPVGRSGVFTLRDEEHEVVKHASDSDPPARAHRRTRST